MKRIMIIPAAIGAIIFAACNNSGQPSKESEISKMNADSMNTAKSDTTRMTEVTPTYNNVDPNLGASLKTVVGHYLDIKNALVHNSGNEAASGGRAMYDAIAKIDKSLFAAEQKKIYDGIEDDLKEHAEHIGKSGGDIAHQREHFSMMSEDMYDLVEAFGGGRALYHDHCPMANDNKGAMWLSEVREVKNPYFGGKMNECVKVQEVIK
jgi:hypothetical protein